MFSRLLFSFFAVSALLALVMADHIPRQKHDVTELHARAPTNGRGGIATWYQPGLGNCGGHNNAKDMIVALPTKVYNKGKYCNKKIKITNKKNGKSCTATVVDSCPGCPINALAIFDKMGISRDAGIFKMDWDFV